MDRSLGCGNEHVGADALVRPAAPRRAVPGDLWRAALARPDEGVRAYVAVTSGAGIPARESSWLAVFPTRVFFQLPNKLYSKTLSTIAVKVTYIQSRSMANATIENATRTMGVAISSSNPS